MLDYDASKWPSLGEFARAARAEFERDRPMYEEFANTLEQLVKRILDARQVRYHTVTARAKDLDSYEKKARKANPTDPTRPKYRRPLYDITDLVGIRVICYYTSDAVEASRILAAEFNEIETIDKGALLRAQGKIGYASIHHIVTLDEGRIAKTEYQRYTGLKAELQVRTVLQHAWAEIEHDVYKDSTSVNDEARRSYILLAGLIELADKEFLRIRTISDELARDTDSAIIEKRPTAISGSAIEQLIVRSFGHNEADVGVYSVAARHAEALGYHDLAQLSNDLSASLTTRAYRALTAQFEDPVVRYYIALALFVGPDRFRTALQDDDLSDDSGWPAFLSAIEAAAGCDDSPSKSRA